MSTTPITELLGHEQAINANTEKRNSDQVKTCANDGSATRIASDNTFRPVKCAKLDDLLYLTIPHFTNAERNTAEPDKDNILIAHCGCGDGNGNARHDKSNSPLAMIAKVFGIHFRRVPFLKLSVSFYRDEAGHFTQEVELPHGWVMTQGVANHSIVDPSDNAKLEVAALERPAREFDSLRQAVFRLPTTFQTFCMIAVAAVAVMVAFKMLEGAQP